MWCVPALETVRGHMGSASQPVMIYSPRSGVTCLLKKGGALQQICLHLSGALAWALQPHRMEIQGTAKSGCQLWGPGSSTKRVVFNYLNIIYIYIYMVESKEQHIQASQMCFLMWLPEICWICSDAEVWRTCNLLGSYVMSHQIALTWLPHLERIWKSLPEIRKPKQLGDTSRGILHQAAMSHEGDKIL